MAETTKELRAVQLAEMGKLEEFIPVGSPTVFRLDSRQWFRPAGNSLRFWKKIEADDPFKPKRVKLSPHRPVYASGRFVRLEDVVPPKPKPQPRPTPKARRIAKLQPEEDTKGPSQVHTPDRKIAPSPLPKPQRPEPEAPPLAAAPKPTEPIDRTPPKIIPDKHKKTSGRIRASDQPRRRSRKLVQGGAPPTGRSPGAGEAQLEASAEPAPDISPDRNLGKRESAAPPAARNIDSVLGALGALKAAQDQFEHEQDLKSQGLLPPKDPSQNQSFSPPPAQPHPKQTAPQKDPSSVPPTARKRTFGTESAPAPEARNIDSVLGVLGALKAAQDQHNHEKEMKKHGTPSNSDVFGEDNWTPPPKPKQRASSPPPSPAPKPKPAQAAPKPAPKPEPKPEPKAPTKAPPKAPVNRAPPKPGGGSLDDLFGGGNEGRLRIGKRTKPKPTED